MPTEFSWSAVLDAWFGETRSNVNAIGPRMAWWFGPDKERDEMLAEMFGDCCQAALQGQLAQWQSEARSRLGLILMLDQFPRNLFRGTPRAFAGDDRAAMLCLSGVAAGTDRELSPAERIFYYMPLQHAEDRITQRVSVKLFNQLAQEHVDQPVFSGCAEYAQLHLDIVEQFGRFPHRNEILGRTSTPEETEYLASGGERFGQ